MLSATLRNDLNFLKELESLGQITTYSNVRFLGQKQRAWLIPIIPRADKLPFSS